MGYAVSDYEGVYPKYGTLADTDELIQACPAQGLRRILDPVINRTSDQHAWFRESGAAESLYTFHAEVLSLRSKDQYSDIQSSFYLIMMEDT
ncbi:hypothetical protein F4780DRAFT_778993 [Xylariomycetidae sp. FL0641]|nr:hypothetical protein F4780DRAFT_778993 [Xylariomycetidae sp. FL0641]